MDRLEANQEQQQQSLTVLIRSHQTMRVDLRGIGVKLSEVTDKLDGLIGAVDAMRVNFDARLKKVERGRK